MIEVARRKKKSSGYESEALRELIEIAKEISKKLDELYEIRKELYTMDTTLNEIGEETNKIEIYKT